MIAGANSQLTMTMARFLKLNQPLDPPGPLLPAAVAKVVGAPAPGGDAAAEALLRSRPPIPSAIELARLRQVPVPTLEAGAPT